MRYSIELKGDSLITRISGNARDFDEFRAKINALKSSYSIKCVTVYIDDVDGGVFDEKKND